MTVISLSRTPGDSHSWSPVMGCFPLVLKKMDLPAPVSEGASGYRWLSAPPAWNTERFSPPPHRPLSTLLLFCPLPHQHNYKVHLYHSRCAFRAFYYLMEILQCFTGQEYGKHCVKFCRNASYYLTKIITEANIYLLKVYMFSCKMFKKTSHL